ncbi:MAG: acetyl-CoA carboxylase carboxyl transferase subunit alpha, partial [Acidobacteriaceae bacterium]|nr:acetyl-CoA carboxylase carboxyl transferase subunit alpha [Acidobacteriaceae bacterium]
MADDAPLEDSQDDGYQPERDNSVEPNPGGNAEEPNPSWQRVQLARHPKRPHSRDYIQALISGFEELHGDRLYGDDPSILAGMGSFEGRKIMIVAQQKGRDTKGKLLRNFGMPKPEGYRKALRLMQLAAKFHRPILTLIDTPG